MLHYKKVLLLLDLSAESERVLDVGKELAEHTQAELVALHVVEFVPVEPMGETLLATPQIEADLIQRAQAKLRDAVANSALTRARCRVEAGNTKAEILRVAADEDADLIVLGSRERHGLAILVNFTEDTVLHAARCDVLAVRLK